MQIFFLYECFTVIDCAICFLYVADPEVSRRGPSMLSLFHTLPLASLVQQAHQDVDPLRSHIGPRMRSGKLESAGSAISPALLLNENISYGSHRQLVHL